MFLGRQFLTMLEGTAAAQRNSLGVVLQWGCRAALGLSVPAGPVRGQGQSTVNPSSSVNAAEEGNAVLVSRLPAPDDCRTRAPRRISAVWYLQARLFW